MKKFVICSIFLLCTWQTAEAALAPLYESIAEIKAILSDDRLTQYLGSSDAIQRIQRTEEGYLIITPRHSITIDLKYVPATRPGPQKFELHFHDPVSVDIARSLN